MDAAAVIRAARERAGLSQEELARRAGTSQPTLHAYERGRVSPAVKTLNRLLAAAGLQLRVALEPLLADLDARVDAMLTGVPKIDLDVVARIADALALERAWVVPPADESLTWAAGSDDEEEPELAHGRPRWAFDGATALALQGLGVPAERLSVVLVWEQAARAFLAREWFRGAERAVSWWSVDLDEARVAVRRGAIGRLGPLQVRFEVELPDALLVQPPGLDRVVPVVTVDEVERAFPVHAEVLARWRERRTVWG